MERTCQTLTVDEIIEINRQAIEMFGGLAFIEPSNFANGNSLLYVLDATSTTFFGQDLYPTIVEKAGAIGWTIIASHVFHDANKRTGMLVCQIFLELNGYELPVDVINTDGTVIEIARRVADKTSGNQASKEDFIDWLLTRVTEIETDGDEV